MTAKFLSSYFSLNRRYTRSINLERDQQVANAILGYIPTERAVETLRRVLAAVAHTSPTCAWTLTGVYGTGKSAFAHFLTALFAPHHTVGHQQALEIARIALGHQSLEYQTLMTKLPKQGLFQAIATGQREPLGLTIIRALEHGASTFWPPGKQPEIAKKLTDWALEAMYERTPIDSRQIPGIIQAVAQAAKTDVLLVIDELGKNLEFAAHHQTTDDLYLLQQLAERSRKQGRQTYLIGLLHQSFADYGHRLATAERSEWAKIQGRFEDIPFTESAEQLIRLMGEAIDRTAAAPINTIVQQQAKTWCSALRATGAIQEISAQTLANAYPLHPVTALVLPLLCTRYAQNDRSLFTFLTSAEPHAFRGFLETKQVKGDFIPTLKLHQVYDYFVESVGTNLASRPNFQRWSEVQGLIADSRHLDGEKLQVLKTIGILNLVTATGALRASRELVTLAMSDQATSLRHQQHWQQVIESLQASGLVTYRKQLNELRIWAGSDFDVEAEVTAWIEKERLSLAETLAQYAPLKPLIAQRHSYRTGTLRCFERRYLATPDWQSLRVTDRHNDGLIGYWVGEGAPTQIPAKTSDGQPLIVLSGANLEGLQDRVMEYAALQAIQRSSPKLAADGVARREVRYRLVQAKQLLEEALQKAFTIANHEVWINGQPAQLTHPKAFQAALSDVCDHVYAKSWILWNELINRRELTSQGAKARRVLLAAMLEQSDQPRLGLVGNGPEVSMYASLLEESGIHRAQDEIWGFYPPEQLGLLTVWQAIAEFCQAATQTTQALDQLYQYLEAPPYGLKRGAIPVVLAAVLLHHAEDISVHKDGTFVPILGAEHFELLVKDPSRFAVKYVGFVGLRAQIFHRLEKLFRGDGVVTNSGTRNGTLLSVVKPLFQFVRKLPPFTTKTATHLSPIAQSVVKAIRQAQEPDKLLFAALPQACKVSPIAPTDPENLKLAEIFCQRLVSALQETQTAYQRLLDDCQTWLYQAFAVRGEPSKLREDLRVRSRHLVDQCVDSLLRRFTLAAVEEGTSDREWLEALVMIVADKPAESWGDEDVLRFEPALHEVARKFKNLEALRSDVTARSREGFEVRRITLTRPDGEEVNRLVWMEQQQKVQVDDIVAEILESANFRDNPQLQQVLAARLTEIVLGDSGLGDQAVTIRPKPQRRLKSS